MNPLPKYRLDNIMVKMTVYMGSETPLRKGYRVVLFACHREVWSVNFDSLEKAVELFNTGPAESETHIPLKSITSWLLLEFAGRGTTQEVTRIVMHAEDLQ